MTPASISSFFSGFTFWKIKVADTIMTSYIFYLWSYFVSNDTVTDFRRPAEWIYGYQYIVSRECKYIPGKLHHCIIATQCTGAWVWVAWVESRVYDHRLIAGCVRWWCSTLSAIGATGCQPVIALHAPSGRRRHCRQWSCIQWSAV